MTLRARHLSSLLRSGRLGPAATLGLLALTAQLAPLMACQSPSLAPSRTGDAGEVAAPAPSGAPQVGAQRAGQRPTGARRAHAAARPAPTTPAAVAAKAAPPFEGTTIAVVLTTNRIGEIEPCG